MAQKRTRDAVWDAALLKTVKKGEPATPKEIAELSDVSERTVRDVLNVMSDSHWVKREVRNDGSVRFKKNQDIWEE